MKLTGMTLLASFALLAGCASSPLRSAERAEHKAGPTEVDQALSEHAEAAVHADAAAQGESVKDADDRSVGDYVTYAFSGAYRKSPLKLTQRVVARGQGSITIDYAFTEKDRTETLRVTLGTEKKTKGTVLEVARMGEGGALAPATAAELEKRMAATSAIADENEALMDKEQTTLKIGESEISATRSKYKVRIGGKSATLETTESDAFAWGDLGGKIVTSDGKVYFQAEVVDAGSSKTARASLE